MWIGVRCVSMSIYLFFFYCMTMISIFRYSGWMLNSILVALMSDVLVFFYFVFFSSPQPIAFRTLKINNLIITKLIDASFFFLYTWERACVPEYDWPPWVWSRKRKHADHAHLTTIGLKSLKIVSSSATISFTKMTSR